MELKEYQTIIEKTAVYPKEIGLAYCALGLTGEAGEVAEKIKKLYRDDQSLANNIRLGHIFEANKKAYSEFRENVKKEVGDVIWYCTALANELGLTLEEILQANYDKLIKRRETGTLHGSGDDREEVKRFETS